MKTFLIKRAVLMRRTILPLNKCSKFANYIMSTYDSLLSRGIFVLGILALNHEDGIIGDETIIKAVIRDTHRCSLMQNP